MTASLAAGGAGLGTHGLPEPVLRQMATDAGFSVVERAPVDRPLNTLFILRPGSTIPDVTLHDRVPIEIAQLPRDLRGTISAFETALRRGP